MPRYDYLCEKNGHLFEVVQGFHDEAVATCPQDGSPARRQISVPHVIYKGSGFYTTDYKNSSNGSNGSKSSSSSSSDTNSSESSSDSSKSKKTESKSESKPASSKSD